MHGYYSKEELIEVYEVYENKDGPVVLHLGTCVQVPVSYINKHPLLDQDNREYLGTFGIYGHLFSLFCIMSFS